MSLDSWRKSKKEFDSLKVGNKVEDMVVSKKSPSNGDICLCWRTGDSNFKSIVEGSYYFENGVVIGSENCKIFYEDGRTGRSSNTISDSNKKIYQTLNNLLEDAEL